MQKHDHLLGSVNKHGKKFNFFAVDVNIMVTFISEYTLYIVHWHSF